MYSVQIKCEDVKFLYHDIIDVNFGANWQNTPLKYRHLRGYYCTFKGEYIFAWKMLFVSERDWKNCSNGIKMEQIGHGRNFNIKKETRSEKQVGS